MKNEIENILSIKVPEEYETYFNSNLSNLNKEDEIIIDIGQTSSPRSVIFLPTRHWVKNVT